MLRPVRLVCPGGGREDRLGGSEERGETQNKTREVTMRWRVRMQVHIEELPGELEGEPRGEGEIVQVSEGA